MSPRITHYAATHAGPVRHVNQDACLCRPDIGLYAVADGAGGHQDGGRAARQTLDRLAALPASAVPHGILGAVRAGAADAHRALCDEADALGPGAILATTLVVFLVQAHHFACLWAGDSRAYLLRGGELHRLTSDHSVVQSLIDAGDLAEADAERHPQAHIITRAIGARGASPLLDKSVGAMLPGDRIMLCSDGVSKTLPPSEMATLLGGPGDTATALITAAMSHGTRDNVTAVTLAVGASC